MTKTKAEYAIRQKDLNDNGLYWTGAVDGWSASISDAATYSAKLSAEKDYRQAHGKFSPTTLELVELGAYYAKQEAAEAAAARYASGSATMASDPAAFGEAEPVFDGEPVTDNVPDTWDEPAEPKVDLMTFDPEAMIIEANGDTGKLFELANNFDGMGEILFGRAYEMKWALGVTLNSAKAAIMATGKLRDWTDAYKANFHGSQSTASRWMRIAEEHQTLDSVRQGLDEAGSVAELAKSVSAKKGKSKPKAKSKAKPPVTPPVGEGEWLLQLTSKDELFLNMGGEMTTLKELDLDDADDIRTGLYKAWKQLDDQCKALGEDDDDDEDSDEE